ncbi:MAG: hypothetical protein WC217_01440 [Candidatus Paceibacterota bacterium]|jgi:hypothetical protein
MQRFLIIGAIVIVVLGLGVGAYFFFFTGTAQVEVTPGGGATLPVSGQGAPVTSTAGSVGTSPTSGSSGSPVSVSTRLVKISAGPVVPGEVAIDRAGSASSSPEVAINYVDRRSGNIYAYLMRAKTLTRISNRTIPGIQSAEWLPDGTAAFVRYLSGTNFSTINTYSLPATGSGGFFLPQDLADISVSGTNILTLSAGVNGSTASLVRTDGTRPVTVFSTPLSSLRVDFMGKGQYLATTKPSATLPGNAYLVDGTGRLSRIAGPHNGLVTLASHTGKWLLVSYTLGSAMQMELVNTATGETVSLPVASIADKCVWAADDSVIYCGIPVNPQSGSLYPDDWYQGAVQFSDRIWKIQVSGRYAQLVLDFSKETKGSLDAESLAVNAANTVLVFTNKNDGSLWSYSL